MVRKKQAITVVGVVLLSFVVGTMFNVDFVALGSDGIKRRGVPFQDIWVTIDDLWVIIDDLEDDIDSSSQSIYDLEDAIDILGTYYEEKMDSFDASLIELQYAVNRLSVFEEISNHTKTIKFVKPGETIASQDWVTAAVFAWEPTNSTNNAILNVYYYAEIKVETELGGNQTLRPTWRIEVDDISNWHHDQIPLVDDLNAYTWAPLYSWVYKGMNNPSEPLYGGISPNQPSYTIKFQIKNPGGGGTVFFRNCTVIIAALDGL